MQTISPFLAKAHLPTGNLHIQLLPPEAHSSEPLTLPQIHTLWLHALSLYDPLILSFRPTITAHKYLLKHLLRTPSTPNTLAVPSSNSRSRLSEDPQSLTPADLKSPTHAPHAFLLFLNLGLILAFTGECFLASRHFRTALGLDDGSTPGNTAVGHYLLGCAFFQLGQYQKAQRSFHQCLLLFRREETLEGKRELVAAAPWTSPLVGMQDKKDTKEKGGKDEKPKEDMWTRFKHKVYEPAASGDDGSKNFKEWDLERKNVEANMQASVRVARAKHKHQGKTEPNTNTGIHGIPGGSLFWPLGEEKSPDTVQKGRKGSKGGKSVASDDQDKQGELVGLGLQMPAQSSTVEEDGPNRNAETRKWEGYGHQPSISRSVSKNKDTQQLSSASNDRKEEETSQAAKQHKRPFTSPSDFLKGIPRKSSTSSKSSTASKKGDAQSAPQSPEHHHDSPMGGPGAKHQTYSPSTYKPSPSATIGSTFLEYYDKTSPEDDDPTPRASQAPLIAKDLTVEEKHHKAWLALNGLAEEDDLEEDNFPTPRQATFSTRKTTVTPIMASTGAPDRSRGKENEHITRRTTVYHESPASTTSPDKPRGKENQHTASRTTIGHDSPYPGFGKQEDGPRATAPSPALAPPTTSFPPKNHTDSDDDSDDDFPLAHLPQTPAPPPPHLSPHPIPPLSSSNVSSPTENRSPASAILSLYGSLTPPDTAVTYSTDNTVFTPSPPPYGSPPQHSNAGPNKHAAVSFTPPPSRPPPSASSNKATPRAFTSSPLNKAHVKKAPLLKSTPRGLGIGIAGLAGPEPAVPLEEAMRVRAKREEEAREEERERKELEKEYRDWMKRLEEEERAKLEGGKKEEGQGELLPRRCFEGFGTGRGEGVSGEVLGVRIGVGGGAGGGGERDESEEEWVAMMRRFHEGTLGEG